MSELTNLIIAATGLLVAFALLALVWLVLHLVRWIITRCW